jgi:hypothetical protein
VQKGYDNELGIAITGEVADGAFRSDLVGGAWQRQFERRRLYRWRSQTAEIGAKAAVVFHMKTGRA